MKKLSNKIYITATLLFISFSSARPSAREKRATLVVDSLEKMSKSIDSCADQLFQGLSRDEKKIDQRICCCIATTTFLTGYSCRILWNQVHQKIE